MVALVVSLCLAAEWACCKCHRHNRSVLGFVTADVGVGGMLSLPLPFPLPLQCEYCPIPIRFPIVFVRSGYQIAYKPKKKKREKKQESYSN